MSDSSSNPARPAPISESELLDWIDGRLSDLECDRLAAASGRIGLKVRIDEMKANRRVLASLPEVEAPAVLMDRVLAALERDTLIGLSDGTPLSDSLPISGVPARHRHQRWWSHSRVQVAMAAGLMLIAGGAAYWGVALSGDRSRPSPTGGELAINIGTTSEATLGEAGASPGAREAKMPGVESPMAVASAETAFGDSEIGDRSPSLALSKARDESSFFVVESTVGKVVTDDARALALAREGRLVMRVIASNIHALPQVTSLAMSNSSLRDWRLTDVVPAATVAMIMPRNIPFGLSAGEPIMASAEAVSLIGPRAMFSWSAAYAVDRASKVRGTFIAELPGKQSVLTAVRSLFA
ncbi:MAG: hypothetical protein PSX37_13355, partial [bacterium]|nr:hypothetical protein [bacterium]